MVNKGKSLVQDNKEKLNFNKKKKLDNININKQQKNKTTKNDVYITAANYKQKKKAHTTIGYVPELSDFKTIENTNNNISQLTNTTDDLEEIRRLIEEVQTGLSNHNKEFKSIRNNFELIKKDLGSKKYNLYYNKASQHKNNRATVRI